MKDMAMFVLILWNSQQGSAVLKMMLPRRIVGCLLCLLISTVFGYCEYELEGVPLRGLLSHLNSQEMATISSVAASRTSFFLYEHYLMQSSLDCQNWNIG
jgi:hypothetical protein